MERQVNAVHGTRWRAATGMQVVRHGALRRSNREIGKSMRIDVDTVKERGQPIFSKRELSGRTQAAVGMLKNNLV